MLSGNRRWLTVMSVLAIVALIGAVASGCVEDQDEKAEPAEKLDAEQDTGQPSDKFDEASGEIINVNEGSFDEMVLRSKTPVLLDFSADWCGPCRALHPILEELADEYAGRVKFAQVNVDENGGLASRYNVRGIPALFVIKNGETVDQVVGLQSKGDLKAMLDRHAD